MMTPPFRTNPSAIARYFFHDCERFLYYTSATPRLRQREGLPEPEFAHSPLIEAILQSGYRWEQEIIEGPLRGQVTVAAGTGPLHTRRLPLAETLRLLRHEAPAHFLYQPTLCPPPAFYQRYHIDPKLVVIHENHPDLLAVLPAPQGRLVRVIDLKRGDSLRLTHRVQILLYALQLQAMLEDEGIEATQVDLEHGAVWLGQQAEPEVFDLTALRPHLERFLRQDLCRILTGSAAEAHWHLYERCQWCELFSHCRDEMRHTNDVSRLAALTTYGKRHLYEEAGAHTLTQLATFLQQKDADAVLGRCASLAGQRHHLQVRLTALATQAPALYGASSPDVPVGENLALFLTLQQEPLGKHIYLAGIHLTGRDEVRRNILSPDLHNCLADADGKAAPLVLVAAAPAETARVRRELVRVLHGILRQAHQHNARQGGWKDQLTLQAYVHTEEERALLCTVLLEALQEPELAEQAMLLLFHFQGPELLQADEHPGNEMAYPVVVLQNALGRLLALPVEVSYTLPEVLDALGSPFHYSRKDYYHFPLGHGLRAEALHAAWYRGDRQNLTEIEQQGGHYLRALAALLRGVRQHASAQLVGWPPRFQLPCGAGIKDPLLSRLAFLARYESLVRCRSVREARSEARPTQVLLGEAIELEARGMCQMEVVGELVVEPEPGGFPGWLLVRDTEEGRRAQVEYTDYWYRNKAHGGPNSAHRAVVGVAEVTRAPDGKVLLRLDFVRPFQDNPPQPGERFLLSPRFTDFTTDGLVKHLSTLDQQGAPLLLDLLRQPETAATPLPWPKRVAAAARAEAALGFTPSQAEAYRALGTQRVTAVWGPPGTGKTHFLAMSIVALSVAHARAGLPFRVLVTAYTHAAIENLLTKIAQRQGELHGKLTLPIGKVKYWQGPGSAAEVVAEDHLSDWLRDARQAVVGATVFSCLKQLDRLSPFDLVVIDEASQVRVPEAAVAVSLVANTGRLVLAGDHLQLPPIIAGTYPEPTQGEPVLHRSIFEAVCRGREPGRSEGAGTPAPLVRQLLENFRMNDALTGLSARLLYGPGYRCVSPALARRRLPFTPGRRLDPLVKVCLDPAYPIVVVVLDGIRAAQANPVEADLAAQLVTALRAGLRDARGRPYTDDATFFREGVFVVSPHHAQINAIQRELARLRSWATTPFVDTVDKMQGQEADAVVISYGVSDPELALREAEFIYGLNRLNVAVTRARLKTIVCLPRLLLEASPQVLDVPAAAQGLAYMRRLVALVEEAGEVQEFEGDAVAARVLRARHIGDLRQVRSKGEGRGRQAL
jgi:hypothetical protein